MKILIDTNIFLDFYRSNNQPINIFSTLLKHNEKIILTDQIIQEFDRSREGVIRGVKQKFESESNLVNFSSSFVQSLPEFHELNNIKERYNAQKRSVNDRISNILLNPTDDPIASYFKELVDESINHNRVLYTTDEIIRRAEKRKLVGNPPTSDKYSLGDEINWEIVLENIQENIVIVGRDNTYTKNFSFLKKDFHRATGHQIVKLTKRIGDALSISGLVPSEELQTEESTIITEVNHYNDYWRPSPQG